MLMPRLEHERLIADLVKNLGHPRFAAREAAMKGLVRAGAAALPQLRAAVNSPDPERRFRARIVLDRIRKGLQAESGETLRQEKLRRLEALSAWQRSNLTPNHPDISSVRRMIQKLKQEIAKDTSRRKRPRTSRSSNASRIFMR